MPIGGPHGGDNTAIHSVAQGSIPISILPTGSVAANGALTLGTALAFAETTGLWGYLPAGAAYAGSAAGFYWIVMSTTSAGTIFDNVYTPGTNSWLPPASPVAIAVAGPGAYAGATGVITAVSVSVPGGLLGPNGSLTHHHLSEQTNNANAKTATMALASTTFTSRSFASNLVGGHTCTLTNVNNQARQLVPPSIDDGASASPAQRLTIDTSVAMTYTITMQHPTATDAFTMLTWSLVRKFAP